MSAEILNGALPSDVFFHRFNIHGVMSFRVEWTTTQNPSAIVEQIRKSFLRLEVGVDGDDELYAHGITPVRIVFKDEPEPRTFSSVAFLNPTGFEREIPNLDKTLKEAIIANRYAVYGLKTEHPGLPFRLVSISALQNLANEATLFYEATASQPREVTVLDRMYLFLDEQTRDLDTALFA